MGRLSHTMVAWAVGVAAGVAGCGESTFRCATDDDCHGIPDGACTPKGFCSLPDEGCPSGRAYAKHSGKLSGQCVGAHDEADEAGEDEHGGPSDTVSADGEVDSTSSGGDTGLEVDESSSDAVVADVGVPEDACHNGVWDPGETDVDCGGPCEPCPTCSSCTADPDCARGRCVDEVCTVVVPFEVDWKEHCTGTMTEAVIDLPSGTWRVRALPSAGSPWAHDGANEGLSWGWRLNFCSGMDFGELRPPFAALWYASPELAYQALITHEIERDHPGGAISCAYPDGTCGDNRGGTVVEFVAVCEGG